MAAGTEEQGPYREPGTQGFGELKILASPICQKVVTYLAPFNHIFKVALALFPLAYSSCKN